MPFELDCPICRNAVTVTDELVGKPAACPHCGEHFVVPPAGGNVECDPVHVSALPRRFVFECQRCGSLLEAMSDQAGRAGSCPTCGGIFSVPQVDPQARRGTKTAVVADDGQLPTPMHAYATAGEKAPRIERLADGRQVIVCTRCRKVMPIDADVCDACGIPFTIEGATSPATGEPTGNTLATASLTVGILAVLTFSVPVLVPVVIGLGIGGLRRARRDNLNSGRKIAIAGIACGALSAVLFVAVTLLG